MENKNYRLKKGKKETERERERERKREFTDINYLIYFKLN